MSNNQASPAPTILGWIRHDQYGITGLETAIVLIAFIVVAAVFAFAVLTTGIFTTERARDTTVSAVGEAQSTLSPKGAAIAEALAALPGGGGMGEVPRRVDVIKFKLANSSGAAAVDLAGATTLLTYSDENQSVNITFAAGALNLAFVCSAILPTDDDVCWSHTWVIGDGPTVDGGEVVEFEVWLDEMGNDLNANQQFKIEVIPAKGAVIPISRKTPLEIAPVMNLN